MSKFLEEQVGEIKTSLAKMADSALRTEQCSTAGIRVLTEIRDAIRFANQKTVDRSVGEHRIAALKRISNAIEYMSSARSLVDRSTLYKFDEIKNILLDIKQGG